MNWSTQSKSASDKNNKYDRQLRLWGDHGQAALETSKVCLINASATGTEILKNLVLPGIGSFTIIDGARVSEEDTGNNFFVTQSSINKSRSRTTMEFLSELNTDVVGNYIDESVESLLNTQIEFFSNFTLVIATNLFDSSLIKLSEYLWQQNIPLVVCTVYGFIGYMRLVIKEHTVIESHPDNELDDLRLSQPFPGFITFCDSLNLKEMNKKDHSHTPWPIIVYKYLEEWKSSHDGEYPRSYKEKCQLKDIMRKGIRKNENGIPEEEENFEEAIRHLNTALLPIKVPESVVTLFQDEKCAKITSESSTFWILTRALKEFVKMEDSMPLRGNIPDMTADTERYIQLQNVYLTKAHEDIDKFSHHLYNILDGIGLGELSQSIATNRVPLSKGVTEADIKVFCRNAAFLRVMKGRSLAEEYKTPLFLSQHLGTMMETDENEELIFYILLRAVMIFHSQYHRLPGWSTNNMETDICLLKGCVTKLLGDWGLCHVVKDDYIHEMCRYGGSELHPVSAYIGGAAAQEVIKLLTGQFVPIDNTFLYNAMKQTSITVKL